MKLPKVYDPFATPQIAPPGPNPTAPEMVGAFVEDAQAVHGVVSEVVVVLVDVVVVLDVVVLVEEVVVLVLVEVDVVVLVDVVEVVLVEEVVPVPVVVAWMPLGRQLLDVRTAGWVGAVKAVV